MVPKSCLLEILLYFKRRRDIDHIKGQTELSRVTFVCVVISVFAHLSSASKQSSPSAEQALFIGLTSCSPFPPPFPLLERQCEDKLPLVPNMNNHKFHIREDRKIHFVVFPLLFFCIFSNPSLRRETVLAQNVLFYGEVLVTM